MTAAVRMPIRLLLALAVALAASLALPAAQAAAAKPKPLRLAFTRCSSVPFPCPGSHTVVVRTGRMLVGAAGMSRRAKVEFPVRSRRTGRVGVRRVGGTFRTATRLLVRVPADAISGRIRVVMPGPRYSNRIRITVRSAPRPPKPVTPPAAPVEGPPPAPTRPAGDATVIDGTSMWVWYLSRSEGGSVERIAARAAAAGVRTVFVKSADGSDVWSQFSRSAVAALKAEGLTVCGWQFVYGNDPAGEARAAAASKTAGADCFVIDAETAYRGKYAQAQRYVSALRTAVGDDFPIGFTSFPYVHYHGALPYSVFLGPGGATFNLPQVYWKDIGDTPDEALAITYQYNRVYGAPITPLGQAYGNPPASEIRRFRQLAEGYGARGTSWWVWDYATASDWAAIGASPAALAIPPEAAWPLLRSGSEGDLVVWAQMHLAGAGLRVTVDGDYGAGTARAVREYQTAKGLPATGALDEATWPTLLAETPTAPNWVARAARASGARASGARAAAASASAGRLPAVNGPRSASMPAVRYEIDGGPAR